MDDASSDSNPLLERRSTIPEFRMGEALTVADVMTDYVLATTVDAALRSAMNAMERHEIRHLPVVDGHRVIGVLSKRELASLASVAAQFEADRDAYEAFLESPVRDFLKTRFTAEADVVTVTPDEPVQAVIDRLVDHRLSALPVVDAEAGLIGIVSYVDILIALRSVLDRIGE